MSLVHVLGNGVELLVCIAVGVKGLSMMCKCRAFIDYIVLKM